MGYSENIQRAEQNLMQAHANRNAAIAAATKGIEDAQVRYSARIRSMEKELRAAQAPFCYNDAELYPDKLVYQSEEVFLRYVTGVSVEVRGGVFPSGRSGFLKDLRELYVCVSSADKAVMVKCDPDDEVGARAFAERIKETVADVDAAISSKNESVARGIAQLEAAWADTRELDAARAAYEAAVNDPSVQQAQLVLDGLKANAPQNELAAYEDAKRHKRYQHRIIAIAVILLAFLLLVAMVTSAVATIR